MQSTPQSWPQLQARGPRLEKSGSQGQCSGEGDSCWPLAAKIPAAGGQEHRPVMQSGAGTPCPLHVIIAMGGGQYNYIPNGLLHLKPPSSSPLHQ